MNPVSDRAILNSLEGIIYVIDHEFLLQFVGGSGWSAFANENGASELADGTAIVGRSLFDFVTGADVQALYRDLVTRILAQPQGPAVFEYRCDAPTIKRRNRLSISPVVENGESKGLLFQSLVLETETRPPINIYDPETALVRLREKLTKPFVYVCSFCLDIAWNSAETSDREWISAEEYYRRGGTEDVVVSHSVCPDCADMITKSGATEPGPAHIGHQP